MLDTCWEELSLDPFPKSLPKYIKKITKIIGTHAGEISSHLSLLRKNQLNIPTLCDEILEDTRYLHILILTIKDELWHFRLEPLWYIKVCQLDQDLEKEIKRLEQYQKKLKSDF